MIEAYKIAVNMSLTGTAYKQMEEFSRLVEKTSRDMEKFMGILKGVDHTFKVFNTDTRRNTTSMRQFDRALTNVGQHASRTRAQVDGLRHSMNSLHTASRRGAGGGSGTGGGMGAGILALGMRYAAPATLAYGAYNITKAGYSENAAYEAGLARVGAMGYGSSTVNATRGLTQQGITGAAPTTQVDTFLSALMATQSPEKAQNLYPVLLKKTMEAKRIYGGMSQHQIDEAIRSGEILGGSDENEVSRRLADVFNLTALSGGTILPSTTRKIVNRNPNLSTEGLLALEPTIQELGERTGTGLRTGRNQLMRGQMGKEQALSLAKFGILGGVQLDKNGRPLGVTHRDFKYADQAFSDPTGFLKDVILPAYKKQGITSAKDISKMMDFQFARTYADVLQVAFKNLAKSDAIRARIPFLEKDKQGTPQSIASQRLEESLKTFENAWGKFTAPTVLNGMNVFASLLEVSANLLTKLSNAGGSSAGTGGLISTFILNRLSGASDLKTPEQIGGLTGITNTGGKDKPINLVVQAKFREKVLLDIVARNLTANSMVNNGTLAPNPSLAGASNAWDGGGGTQSQ